MPQQMRYLNRISNLLITNLYETAHRFPLE